MIRTFPSQSLALINNYFAVHQRSRFKAFDLIPQVCEASKYPLRIWNTGFLGALQFSFHSVADKHGNEVT